MDTNTTSAASGIDATPAGSNPTVNTDFKAAANGADTSAIDDDLGDHHHGGLQMHDPFGGDKLDRIAGDDDDMHMPGGSSSVGGGGGSGDGSPTRDRRMSKEWDASKVPPSRFQKRSGSIYSTPSSRDAHLTGTGSERDKGYWEKMKEKGWIKK